VSEEEREKGLLERYCSSDKCSAWVFSPSRMHLPYSLSERGEGEREEKRERPVFPVNPLRLEKL
jgi:hypothetical protein